jgi:mono/diheme cytochrome c family protein
VCAYPRGVAVADAEQVVHVACSEGKLVSLSTVASETTPVRTLTLDHDLRDVVVASDGLWVSRFRSAEVLRLDAAGAVVRRTSLPNSVSGVDQSISSVAWRMVAGANGGVVVVHQRAFTGSVIPSPGGYNSSGAEGGIVQTAISTVSDSGETLGTSVPLAARLAVDVAQSPLTGSFLLASATIEHPVTPSGVARTLLMRPVDLNFKAAPGGDFSFALSSDPNATIVPSGQLVAVAFAGDTPVLQYREPSRLVFGDRGVSLPGNNVEDTGNTLFHLETSSGLACASCHPEGQDDGHVWNFQDFGPRRTQSRRGGLLGSEPFHWDGAESDFTALTTDVMQGRMGGPELTAGQTTALAGYIDKFPAMPAASALAGSNVDRGRVLFNDTTVGCATCHSGTRFSNNQTMDVGSKDGYLQVPSLLGAWARAPFLHDGCAKTMADRFTLACDTRSMHGNTASLTPADVGALSDYLETL